MMNLFTTLPSVLLGQSDWTIENIQHLKWLNLPDPALLIAIGAVALVFFASLYFLEPKVPLWGKVVLVTLRICALLVCLLVLFKPILSFERHQVRESYALVLIDQSRSMSYKDRYSSSEIRKRIEKLAGDKKGQSRLTFVKALFGNEEVGLMKKLREKNHLRLVSFADKTYVMADLKKGGQDDEADWMDKVESLKPKGRFTRLGQCLMEAKNDLLREGHRIAAVVLLTDGQSNAGQSPIRAARKLAGSRIPLYIFGVGNPKEEKDIELFGLHTRKRARVGDFIPFDFKVRSKGFDGKDLHVTLKKEDKTVHRQFLHLQKGARPQDVRFKYKVGQPGRYEFTVEIPVQDGEWNTENNTLTAVIDVQDKKLWVLYVEGYPRWEYRYLKNALIRDRTLKVRTLLQSADAGYPQESSPDIRPIRHFPDTALPYEESRATHPKYTEEQKEDILKQLRKYNVIIFGDVPPSQFNAAQLAAMGQFVEEGGGFIMISGEKFAPHSYYGTPIANILPVELEKPELVEVPMDETLSKAFKPRLTPEGERHIITRFKSNVSENKELWEGRQGLPGFYWFSTVKRSKPGAIVLAQHPGRKNKYGYYPLFALHTYGSGKAMFSAIDSTWRWRAGVGDAYFYSFWSQAIRHMATGSFRDRDKKFILNTDQNLYVQGDTVFIYAIVRKSKKSEVPLKVYGPFDTKKVKKKLDALRGDDPKLAKKARLSAILNLIRNGPDPKPHSLNKSLGSPDNFEGDITVYQKGTYFLELGKPYVSPKGEIQGGDVAQISVTEFDKEKLQIRLNERVLKQMAKITDGKYAHLFADISLKPVKGAPSKGKGQKTSPTPEGQGDVDLSSLTSDLPTYQERVPEVQREIPLWKKWWILPIFLIFITFEWLLRKLFRLL